MINIFVKNRDDAAAGACFTFLPEYMKINANIAKYLWSQDGS